MPLIRFAEVHMLNNYFQDVRDTAINVRMDPQVLVEGNYFENVGAGTLDPATGFIKGPVGNTPHEHLESTTDFTVPYNYDAHSPQDAREVVTQFAKVGVLDVTP